MAGRSELAIPNSTEMNRAKKFLKQIWSPMLSHFCVILKIWCIRSDHILTFFYLLQGFILFLHLQKQGLHPEMGYGGWCL